MTKEKAITWKYTRTTKPLTEVGKTVYDVLMCQVYFARPGEDLEWYYEIGSFRDGKFYDKDGTEYFADYWASINEPHAWGCDPSFDVLAGLEELPKLDEI